MAELSPGVTGGLQAGPAGDPQLAVGPSVSGLACRDHDTQQHRQGETTETGFLLVLEAGSPGSTHGQGWPPGVWLTVPSSCPHVTRCCVSVSCSLLPIRTPVSLDRGPHSPRPISKHGHPLRPWVRPPTYDSGDMVQSIQSLLGQDG